MTDNDLNDLIDSVARQVTAGDPPAHLHARVLAQLGERARWPSIWKWAPAALVLAGLLVATVLVHRAPPPVGPASVRTAGASTPVPSPAANPPGSASPDSAAVQTVNRVAKNPPSRAATRRIADDLSAWQAHAAAAENELAWRDRAIPALGHPESVTLVGIQPTPLEIRPLNTAPLSVAPMGEDINKQ
jgi:hypothetical protein